MPKSATKSSTTQASISRYFGALYPNPAAHQFPRGKPKLSSDRGRLLTKRAKLSLKEQRVEDLQSESKSYHSAKESNVASQRKAGRLSISTLQKLQGFTCTSDPGVRHTEDQEQINDFPIEIDLSPCSALDKRKITNTLEHAVKKHVSDNKDIHKMDASPKQVFHPAPFAKSGRGGESVEELSSPSDSSAPSRPLKSVYTPLEQQVIWLKQQHKDALLAVECGYKYRFFGEDAEIASKELNIFCHRDHNFMTCSIPTRRLFVHVRRLVSHGHKVGVVNQTETSALKASGVNKNTLFTRQLSALYTKSTLVGEDVNPVTKIADMEQGSCGDTVLDPAQSFMMCISENWDKLKKHLTVGMVAVQPSTGDVLLDCFPDGPLRAELEARVLKINPVEILVPTDLSEQTFRLLQSITNASIQADDHVRVEQRDCAQFEFTSALKIVTQFYGNSQEEGSCSLSRLASFESPVICCLGPLIDYLKEFNLERILQSVSTFRCLSSELSGLILSASTLKNLEILNNQTDRSVKGSLLWVMDHTCTPFGKRLMRKWVSQPLTDPQSISERQDAVQEILESDTSSLYLVKSLLLHLPDLERGICSIYHRKSSTQEFYIIISSLSRLGLELQTFLPAIQSEISSVLLRSILLDMPDLLVPIHSFLKVLNERAAKLGMKTELFTDLSGFPVLQERTKQIQALLNEIQDHQRDIRLILKVPTIDYVTVSGQEFLIEVKTSLSSIVPADWVKINSTKAVNRYHSPFLVNRYKKLLQLREQLLLNYQEEWTNFLNQFGEHYHSMKRVISYLATMDCLFSLADMAKRGGYCRPKVSETKRQIVIRNGRHPAINQLMGEQNQYVPNHTELEGESRRTMIITGPNMGGKSSYIRQVGLICIMAQIGSYVPASEACLGILDGVYTRMGASDNIYKGHSTFMEELTEVSEVISHATQHSLVILDELGRGTSTQDGIAIAYATLEYFIKDVKALTLFVTHYSPLCEIERVYPELVSNYHMAFLLSEPDIHTGTDDGDVQSEFITFLYQLIEGAAERSYGLNVARLADIPDPVLYTAARKARQLENLVNGKRKNKKLVLDLWSVSDRSTLQAWLQSNY